MLNLLRRHLILTVCTVVAIVLVFVGWSVRPDMATTAEVAAPQPTTTVEPEWITAIPPPIDTAVTEDSQRACELPPEWLQPDGRWDRGVNEERIDRVLEFSESAFLESQNVDELVFAATLADQSGDALRRFEAEINSGAQSPYLLFKAVDRCYAKNGSATRCPRELWLDLLTRLDFENSEVWIRVAGLRFNQGNDEAGMAALERAAAATESNDYYGRDLQNFLSGFGASGELDRFEAARLAIALAGSDLPAIEYHFYACTSPEITDARRLQLCEQYAANVKSRPITNVLRNVAERFDLFSLKARGKVDEVEQLERAREERTRLAVSNVPTDQAYEFFERLNPDLLYEYINDVALFGEREADERRRQRLEAAGIGDFRERCSEELRAYGETVDDS